MNVAIPRNYAHLSATESRGPVCVNRRLQVPYSVCVDIKLTALETTAIAFDDDESTTTMNGVAIAVVIAAANVATATVTTTMTIVGVHVLRSLTMVAAVVAVASVYFGRVLNVLTNLN